MFRITETLDDGTHAEKDIASWPRAIGILVQWVLTRGETDGHNHKTTYTIEWY